MSGLMSWVFKQPLIALLLLALLWGWSYVQLPTWSQQVVMLFPIDPSSHLFESLSFFFYDVPKILMLLVAITCVMGIINSYFTPEKHVPYCLANMKAWGMCWRHYSVL
jgi:hypothetical protein